MIEAEVISYADYDPLALKKFFAVLFPPGVLPVKISFRPGRESLFTKPVF